MGAFDTIGSNLFMSANQTEPYQALAQGARFCRKMERRMLS